MMIQWNGLGCFTVTGKPIAGEATLVVDPYGEGTGLRVPKTLSGAVVAQTHDGVMANNYKEVAGSKEHAQPFFVSHAGEYEVEGIFIRGIHAPLKDGSLHTIYRVVLEGMSIAFLGALDRPLTDSELQAFGDIDFLVLPVGGESVLTAKEAAEAVAQIEPRVVVPSHFAMPALDLPFAGVENFCAEVACKREDMVKISMQKKDLPLEDIRLIVLSKA